MTRAGFIPCNIRRQIWLFQAEGTTARIRLAQLFCAAVGLEVRAGPATAALGHGRAPGLEQG